MIKQAKAIILHQLRDIKHAMTRMHPLKIKGLLFPHLLCQLSLKWPTIGCPIVPHSGPASQINDRMCLGTPNEMRYGVACVNSSDQANCRAPRSNVRVRRYPVDLIGINVIYRLGLKNALYILWSKKIKSDKINLLEDQ